MRRFLSIFTILMLIGVWVSAQTRVLSGKVTDKDGATVPFASIKIKGSKSGSQADANGAYTIKVKEGDVLEISAANFKTIEAAVGTQDYLNNSLEKTGNLTEVVVTSAYNRKTTARSATSNVQVVSADQLNTIRAPNINNALAGKVAGIQVRSQSAAALGRATDIRLRGDGGFGGGGGPIYVVDGTILPNSNDINPDDIEDLSVLNGPQAAALFGTVGQNGAIVVSLKKAKKSNRNIGIEINSGVTFDKVYILPNYQNSYAGGDNTNLSKFRYIEGQHPAEWKALDGKYYPDFTTDESWGVRMVGQEYVPWYGWYGGHERSYKTELLTPEPNNAKGFFNTGVTINNNISFSKATDNTSIRVSYSNINVKGLVPTTGLKKNTLTTVFSMDMSPKLILNGNINYYTATTNGLQDDDFSNQSTGSFNQYFHRDIDINILKELKDLQGPDGVYASWNRADPQFYNKNVSVKENWGGTYWMNHFKFYDLATSISRNDRLYGNIGLTYKFTPEFLVKVGYRKQQNTTFFEQKYSTQILNSVYSPNAFQIDTRWGGYYGTQNTFSNIENYEAQFSYTKKIKDFGINAFGGIDIRKVLSKSNGANTVADPVTFAGLSIPDLFTIANSKTTPNVFNGRSEEKSRAVFIISDLNYKNYLFFNVTLRRDWYSTLLPTNNGVTTKSLGASFVFSDLVKNELPFLSYGKIRLSWGESPSSVAPYVFGSSFTISPNQWDGNLLSTRNDLLISPTLKGAVKSMKDIGIDLRFLKNRIGISATYYNGSEKGNPVTIPLTAGSGYSSLLTNVGLITKKGIELTAMFRPIWAKSFKWEMTANWGRLLDNKVVDIYPGIDRLTIDVTNANSSPVSLVHIKGEQWGSIFGVGVKRLNGQPVINSDGLYVADQQVNFGSVLTKFTGGVQNRFDVFNNFNFSFNIDFQSGGRFFSLSDWNGNGGGLLARTAELNDKGIPQRDPISEGGGYHVKGVDENGKAVDKYIESRTYWKQFLSNGIRDFSMYDLTFVKLREVGFGYKIPVSKVKMAKSIQAATFSILVRNPWLIYAKTKDFDPSEISGATGESGNLPGTRGIGVNLKVIF